MVRRFPFLTLLAALFAAAAQAQGNYEVQVYGYELVPPNVTMVELHSNFTASGTKEVIDGVRPTNHALHETLEITHGFNDVFETGFYLFNALQADGSWVFVGTHIRPRAAVPKSWNWPVGVSVSNEIGWQRPNIAADTWTWEIRPIIDKKIDKWYLCFNPTFDHSFRGPESKRGFEFSPNAKVSFDVTKKIAAGMEYYGSYGPVTGFDPLRDQQQQFLPAIDVDFGSNWEFNFGIGIGVTRATDHLLIKAILGYRFNSRKDNRKD